MVLKLVGLIRVIGTTSNNGIYNRNVTASIIIVATTDILVNEVTTATTSIVGILNLKHGANERFGNWDKNNKYCR